VAEVNQNSLVTNFLDLMGGYWDYNIPLTTQWAVAIVPDTYDTGGPDALFEIIKKYTQIDAHNFFVPTSVQNKLLNDNTQPKFDGLGLYYAQSIKLPKEAFSVTGAGLDNMGGYLKGFVGSDRMGVSERAVHIDFLETNLDFVYGLIRPWIIAAGYRGLVNTGKENSIKCTITVQEFTRERDYDLKPTRLMHTFEGCVPIDVPDRTLKYDSEPSEAPVAAGVTWMYEKYRYDADPSNSRNNR